MYMEQHPLTGERSLDLEFAPLSSPSSGESVVQSEAPSLVPGISNILSRQSKIDELLGCFEES